MYSLLSIIHTKTSALLSLCLCASCCYKAVSQYATQSCLDTSLASEYTLPVWHNSEPMLKLLDMSVLQAVISLQWYATVTI